MANADKYLNVAQSYLTDSTGARLSLSPRQRDDLMAVLHDYVQPTGSSVTLRDVVEGGFAMTADNFRAINAKLDAGFASVLGAIAASHKAEMQRMEEIMDGLIRVNRNVDIINQNVNAIGAELSLLANEFRAYREADLLNNAVQRAETRKVSIKQDIKNKFGHHDEMRRNAIGILQASDVGVVRTGTAVTRAEELMLATPNYWLSPAIVALAAWFNDDREVAEAALANAMSRDADKTALFFALINRRAGRLVPAVRWLNVYMANQTPHDVDYKCIVLLNAYAAGLFGSDNDSGISSRMIEWLEELAAEPGFDQKLVSAWDAFFQAKGLSAKDVSRKYMTVKALTTPETWDRMMRSMSGAYLNGIAKEWFKNTMDAVDDPQRTRAQVDHLLATLISDFDEEELDLRKELDRQELIIGFDGREDAAEHLIAIKERFFSTRSDFIQIITNAAQFPEQAKASASTQNFAIALEMPWIIRSFTGITDTTQRTVPETIGLTLDGYTCETENGRNEKEIIDGYVAFMNEREREALQAAAATTADVAMLAVGLVLGLIGLIVLFAAQNMWGFVLILGFILAGVGGVRISRARKKQEQIRKDYAERRRAGVLVLRKAIAEVVDWRREFAKKFNESKEVMDFLNSVTPDQQIRKATLD